MRATLLLPMLLLPMLLLPMLILASVPVVHASQGDCEGGPRATGEHEIGDGTAAHTFYIDDRNYLLGNGLWLYEESNGIFGPHTTPTTDPTHPAKWLGDPYADLQRGGGSILNPVYDAAGVGEDNEVCTDDPSVAPDTLIF